MKIVLMKALNNGGYVNITKKDLHIGLESDFLEFLIYGCDDVLFITLYCTE